MEIQPDELPQDLKVSLEKMNSRELSLKQKFDKIKNKQTQFGNNRPPGSFMDPKLSEIYTKFNNSWIKKTNSPDASPEQLEKIKKTHTFTTK